MEESVERSSEDTDVSAVSTQMVAGMVVTTPYSSTKIVNANCSAWPEPIDTKTDILTPNKVDKWKAAATAALRTRKLWATIQEVPPTMASLAEDNPGIAEDHILQVLDTILEKRRQDEIVIASNMINTIKMSSLSLTHSAMIFKMQQNGEGVAMFQYIWDLVDLTKGEPQDRVRAEYPKVKVQPTDSMSVICQAVDRKWWLFKNNTLLDSVDGQKEGVRDINTMLLEGPTMIRLAAISAIQFIDSVEELNGDEWVRSWQELHNRYGKLLVNKDGAAFTAAAEGEDGAALLATQRDRELRQKKNEEKIAATNTCAANGGNAGMGCRIFHCEGRKNKGGDCILRTTEPLVDKFEPSKNVIEAGRKRFAENPRPETIRDFTKPGTGGKGGKGKGRGGGGRGGGRGGAYWMFGAASQGDAAVDTFSSPHDPRSHELYDSEEDDWDTAPPPPQSGAMMMLLTTPRKTPERNAAAAASLSSPVGSKRTPIKIKYKDSTITPNANAAQADVMAAMVTQGVLTAMREAQRADAEAGTASPQPSPHRAAQVAAALDEVAVEAANDVPTPLSTDTVADVTTRAPPQRTTRDAPWRMFMVAIVVAVVAASSAALGYAYNGISRAPSGNAVDTSPQLAGEARALMAEMRMMRERMAQLEAEARNGHVHEPPIVHGHAPAPPEVPDRPAHVHGRIDESTPHDNVSDVIASPPPAHSGTNAPPPTSVLMMLAGQEEPPETPSHGNGVAGPRVDTDPGPRGMPSTGQNNELLSPDDRARHGYAARVAHGQVSVPSMVHDRRMRWDSWQRERAHACMVERYQRMWDRALRDAQDDYTIVQQEYAGTGDNPPLMPPIPRRQYVLVTTVATWDGRVLLVMRQASVPTAEVPSTRDAPHGAALPLFDTDVHDSASLPLLVLYAGSDLETRPSSVAKAARKRGATAVEVDFATGDTAQDLMDPANQRKVLKRIASRRTSGVHTASPCSSFSVLADKARSMAHVRGMPGLVPAARARVDIGNTHADFVIDVCWACFKANVSVSVEFPAYRGNFGVPPTRAYWPEKADYPTIQHFSRMEDFIEASGAIIITFPMCAFPGCTVQKYTSILVWPPAAAQHMMYLHGHECSCTSHAEHAVGKRADEAKVYPPALDELLASVHVGVQHVASAVGVLAAMPPSAPDTIRMLSDSGASDCFAPSDAHCVPGTDGPPTVGSVMVGDKEASMVPQKSCVLMVAPLHVDMVFPIRVNIANVPLYIMSEGYMVDEFNATFTRSRGVSNMVVGDATIQLWPGAGRMSRLGFATFRVKPTATLFLHAPVINETQWDVDPFVQWLPDAELELGPDDGAALMFKGYAPTHVHMQQPKYTAQELYQLLHCRHMHPALEVLDHTCNHKLTVGHDWAKIPKDTLKVACKHGCSVCNAMFIVQHQKGGPTARPPDTEPVGVMDSFGPLAVPTVYHNYRYFNSVVHVQSGWILTEGSTGIAESVLEATCNAFRAFVRPYVGELATIRTDSIAQTTTSKQWHEYTRGASPMEAEHTTGGKHYPLGQIERVHKEAWPMVLAALKTARRGLKWTYVVWRHAILLINIRATRRDGAVTSRFVELFKTAFNQSVLRVILSPCQYYVDKDQRNKPDPKCKNGLWCGISPDNMSAAWIWTGRQFVTVDHGDVRTNEWVAWSISPVGVDTAQADPEEENQRDLVLFTDETQHRISTLLAVKPLSGTELAQVMRTMSERAQCDAATSSTLAQVSDETYGANSSHSLALQCEPAVETGAAPDHDASPAPDGPISVRLSDAEETAFPRVSEPPLRTGSSPQVDQVLPISSSAPVTNTQDSNGVEIQPPAAADKRTSKQHDEPPKPPRSNWRPERSSAMATNARIEAVAAPPRSRRPKYAPPVPAIQRRAANAAHAAVAMMADDIAMRSAEARGAVEHTEQVQAPAVAAEFDAMDAYSLVSDECIDPTIAKNMGTAFAAIAARGASARQHVSKAMHAIESRIDALYDAVTSGDEGSLFSMLTEDDEGAIYVMGEEPNDHAYVDGAGVLASMVTVYDATGRPMQIEQPDNWRAYEKSPNKEMWTPPVVEEVEKLIAARTWRRLPRSMAKGHKIHRLMEIFKVKTTADKKLDKLKFRLAVMGNRFTQGMDYLEHYSAGADFGCMRMNMINCVSRKAVRFKLDVTNAFPQVKIERKIFIELPKGPFDWNNTDGERDVGLLEGNLYGIPPAPRTFTKQFRKHLHENGVQSCSVQLNAYHREGEDGRWVDGTGYVDEIFGGASSIDEAIWFKEMVERFAPVTFQLEWQEALGFGVEVDETDPEDPRVTFKTRKYVLSLVERFLKGESKPDRQTASRQTIMSLQAEELPPAGSPEDLAMAHMQSEARALCGGMSHLSRGRFDVCLEHALCAQCMSRPTYSMFEHLKEALRFAWAHIDEGVVHHAHSLVLNPAREPIRPYDADVEYGLYGMSDGSYVKPGDTIVTSKSMGGYAVMFGAAAIEWKSFRFHAVVVDTTSAESQAASRLTSRLVYFGALARFWGIAQNKPPYLFTDNDGLWYQAKDAADVTKMAFVIRHVRFIQQGQEMELTAVHQVDTALLPVDVFTKWMDKSTRMRHYLFMRGFPHEARAMWRASAAFKQWKPKRIVPVPEPPIEIDEDALEAAASHKAKADNKDE